MQRQSADFPRDSAGAAAFEEILALVAGDRGASPFETGFEPWTARGGLQVVAHRWRTQKGPVRHGTQPPEAAGPPFGAPGAPVPKEAAFTAWWEWLMRRKW